MSSPPVLSVKRLIALVLIFLATAGAWLILAGVVQRRTSGLDDRLRSKVHAMWGSAQAQREPQFTGTVKKAVTIPARGRTPARTYTKDEAVTPTVNSDITVGLAYEPRRKGLLWYNLYAADFRGAYRVENTLDKPMTVILTYPFPDSQSVYDRFAILLDGEDLALTANTNWRTGTFTVDPHAARTVTIAYRTQGMDSWKYAFGSTGGARGYGEYDGVQTIRDFRLTTTTDFADVDFVDRTLAPQEKIRQGDGWELRWSFDQLIAGQDIGILVPKKLNPGPFVQRVTLFAPIALAFYFFVLVMIAVIRRIPLHPMHFAFLAAAFFSFHLLFAYLVDHLAIRLAFGIAAVVSVALAVSYLRLVVGLKFAFVEAGLAQLIYLVAFTYSFFFEGYTGLIIAILATLTLAVMMQLTARVPWAQLFAKSEPPQG